MALHRVVVLVLALACLFVGPSSSPNALVSADCECACPPENYPTPPDCPLRCAGCVNLTVSCSCYTRCRKKSRGDPKQCSDGYVNGGTTGDGCRNGKRRLCELSCDYPTAACAACAPMRYGPDCELCPGGGVCSNRGNCSDGISGTGQCECEDGSTGDGCQFTDAETCAGNGVAQNDGTCLCDPGFDVEVKCSACAEGYFDYPTCRPCSTALCSERGTCNNDGFCVCNAGYDGDTCDECEPNFYKYPDCVYCNANTTCSGKGSCDAELGTCNCLPHHSTSDCNECDAGYYGGSDGLCKACPGGGGASACSSHGVCDDGMSGQGGCQCNPGYRGDDCGLPSITQLRGLVSTLGGVSLSIDGHLFGETTGTVTINGEACTPSQWDDELIVCQAPAGQGADLPLVVTRSSDAETHWTNFSYTAPSIHSISPTSGPAAGGETVTVFGDSFGPSPVLAFASADGVFVNPVVTDLTTLSVTTSPRQRFEFEVPAGNGGASMKVTAGSQTSSEFTQFEYETLEATGFEPYSGDTSGGFVVTITGSNFGESLTAVQAEFKESPSATTAAPCLVTAVQRSDSRIVCNMSTSAPDLLGDLRLYVSSDGTTSVPPGSFRFNAPSISRVRAPGCSFNSETSAAITTCPTLGLELTIYGSNFGSDVSNLGPIFVGNEECESPVIAVPHVEVHCTLPGMAGFNLDVTLERDGNTAVLPDAVSFTGPVISATTLVFVDKATVQPGTLDATSTQGGDRVRFSGTFTDADTAGATVRVVYGPDRPGLDNCRVDEANALYPCVVDTANTNSAQVQCTTQPGIGFGLHFQVCISLGGVNSSTNVGFDTYSYPTPSLTPGTIRSALSGPPSTSYRGFNSDGEVIMFSGLHFGPNPSEEYVRIRYGPSSDPLRYDCIVDASRSNDTQLACRTSPGSGSNLRLTVSVGLTTATTTTIESTDTYSYPAAPSIVGIRGCSAPPADQPELANATVGCPTTGLWPDGSNVVLSIYGTSFPPDLSDARIEIGGRPCLGLVPDASTPFELLRCRLPAGTGVDQEVTAEFGVLSARPVEYVSYAAPTVTSIRGCTASGASTVDCARQGGQRVTLHGANFGEDNAQVIVGGAVCSDVLHGDAGDPGNTALRHSRISCVLPPGSGTQRSVLVVQQENDLALVPATVSYVQCRAGEFSQLGNTTCLDCDVGRFSQFEGQSSCAQCSPGRFASRPGSVECSQCEVGKAQNESGQAGCRACNVGRFAERTASVTCALCPTGRFSPGISASGCSLCSKGFFQADSGQSGCLPCAAGRFAASDGSGQCQDCVEGKFARGQGSLVCTSCPAGKFAPSPKSTECTPCDTGKFSSTAAQPTCLECPEGFFAGSPGSQSCQQCPRGRFTDVKGTSVCSECPAGTISTSSGLGCELCEAGTIAATNGSFVCTACGVGSVQRDRGQSECDLCAPGKVMSSTGQRACVDCPTGSIAAHPGLSVCSTCPRGSYSDDQGTGGGSTCKVCTAGKVSAVDGSTSCEDCAPGRFAPDPGMSQCVPCSRGLYQSSPGSGRCLECPLGKFGVSLAATICEDCAVGTFGGTEGLTRCETCEAGSVASTRGLSTCSPCVPGSSAPFDGMSECINCPAGTFTDAPGQSLCSDCPAGTFSFLSSETGPTSCTSCENGTFADREGTEDCSRCDPGTFAPSDGAVTCSECPAGASQALHGQDDCDVCPPGRFNLATGQIDCFFCQRGRYAPVENQTECTPCEAGKYQSVTGASHCETCERGRFSDSGKHECTECAERSFAPLPGSSRCETCPDGEIADVTRTRCICRAGDFFYVDRCRTCPEGADCSEPGQTYETLGTAAGYWRPTPESLTFYTCLQERHCLGGRNSTCGEGLDPERLCAVCLPGYKATARSDCVPCSGEGTNVAIFVVIVFFVSLGLCVLYYVLLWTDRALLKIVRRNDRQLVHHLRVTNKQGDDNRGGFDEAAEINRSHNMALQGYRPVGKPNMTFKLKILVGFFQISSNLAFRLQQPWPKRFSDFISAFNVLNMDVVEWSSVGCVTRMDYYDKLFAVTGAPLVVVALLSSFFWAVAAVYYSPGTWLSSRTDPYKKYRLARKRLRRQYWKLLLFTMFLVYPHVSATVLSMYVCKEVEGVSYMVSDFTLECFDTRWLQYLPYNILMIVMYPIGIPAFFAYMLFRYRRRFHEPGIRLQLGFLYDGYALNSYFFELADMAHKVILVSLLAFFPEDTQLPVGMAVVTIYLMVILLRTPYWRTSDDLLHMLSQTELYLLLSSAYVFRRTLGDDLSDSDDLVMSIFLILVFLGFLGVFMSQTYAILKRAVRSCKRHLDRKHLTRKLQSREGATSSAVEMEVQSSASLKSNQDDEVSMFEDLSSDSDTDSDDEFFAGEGSARSSVSNMGGAHQSLERSMTKAELVAKQRSMRVSLAEQRRMRDKATANVLFVRNPLLGASSTTTINEEDHEGPRGTSSVSASPREPGAWPNMEDSEDEASDSDDGAASSVTSRSSALSLQPGRPAARQIKAREGVLGDI